MAHPDFSKFVLIGIACYMALMLGIGFLASKRIHTLSDFLVAGRRLSFPLAFATLFATWFGAGSCLGAAGAAYTDGFLGVMADPFAAGISLIIAGAFYVGLFRKLELLTVTDIFGKYYDKGSEIFASLLMIPVYIGWLGAQMVALGFLLNIFAGVEPTHGIMIGALIVVIYTFAGGMWAVTLTDVIQIIILVSGLFLIFPIVMSEVDGLQELWKHTPEILKQTYPTKAGYHDWMSYIGDWCLMGLGVVVGQDLVQRSLSSKTQVTAIMSATTAGVAYILIGFIPIFLGLAGRFIVPELDNPELVIPNLAMLFLHPVFIVLFLGALISAIMSSADSSLLAATSLLTRNVLLRIFPKTEDKQVLLWTRWGTVVLALLSMIVALKVQQIYDLMVNSWATLFVCLFVPITFALYWKKANRLAAWASMIAGLVIWLGAIFLTAEDSGISDPLLSEAAVYGGVSSLITYVLVTLLFYKPDPAEKRTLSHKEMLPGA